MSYSYWGVLSAGLLSFFSPCVFSLVPAYLSYLAGDAANTYCASDNPKKESRCSLIVVSFYFVLGMSTVFMLIGASVGAVGDLLRAYKGILQNISGILLIVFGLCFLGGGIPFLQRYLRFNLAVSARGYTGSYVMGLLFAAGWTPCIGPVLGSILVLVANHTDARGGIIMLLFYSIGMGVPFIVTAALMDRGVKIQNCLAKHVTRVNQITGVILILLGLSYVTGTFGRFVNWMDHIVNTFQM